MNHHKCGQCIHFNPEKCHCEKRTRTEWWGIADCKAITLKLEVEADSSAKGCAVFAMA
jgi:hypothetical protein